MAKLNENMYKFAQVIFCRKGQCGIIHLMRAVISWGTYRKLTAIFLKRHPDEGYQPGDYAGKAGIERTYEKVLMGQRGIEFYKGIIRTG